MWLSERPMTRSSIVSDPIAEHCRRPPNVVVREADDTKFDRFRPDRRTLPPSSSRTVRPQAPLASSPTAPTLTVRLDPLRSISSLPSCDAKGEEYPILVPGRAAG